jgi:hypothetical protein
LPAGLEVRGFYTLVAKETNRPMHHTIKREQLSLARTADKGALFVWDAPEARTDSVQANIVLVERRGPVAYVSAYRSKHDPRFASYYPAIHSRDRALIKTLPSVHIRAIYEYDGAHNEYRIVASSLVDSANLSQLKGIGELTVQWTSGTAGSISLGIKRTTPDNNKNNKDAQRVSLLLGIIGLRNNSANTLYYAATRLTREGADVALDCLLAIRIEAVDSRNRAISVMATDVLLHIVSMKQRRLMALPVPRTRFAYLPEMIETAQPK